MRKRIYSYFRVSAAKTVSSLCLKRQFSLASWCVSITYTYVPAVLRHACVNAALFLSLRTCVYIHAYTYIYIYSATQ